MPTYHTTDLLTISIPEKRQRKIFSEPDIQALAEDIQKPHGLLHPIVLANDERTLIAGHRRYLAITSVYASQKTFTCHGEDVPFGMVPYVTLGELSQDQIHEAELSENICRVQLTWQERVEALAELTAMRKLELSEELGKPPTILQVAKAVTQDPTLTHNNNIVQLVGDAEILAANLHRPEVAKAPSAKKATKILQRELAIEAAQNAAKTQRLSLQSPHTFKQISLASEEALSYSDFDCVITDPPYGVNAHTFRSGDSDGSRHHYEDTWEYAQSIYESIFKNLPLWLKEHAHAYIFFDIKRFAIFSKLAVDLLPDDFYVWPRPFIWYKGQFGNIPDPLYGAKNTYDAILYIRRGKRAVLSVQNDVILLPQVSTHIKGPRLHMAEKPVDLYKNLLSRTCRPGNRVLDPCCGSGTIFTAAEELSLLAVGFDSDETSAALSLSTLSKVTSNGAKDPA